MKLRQLQTKSSERSIELDRQIRRQLVLHTNCFMLVIADTYSYEPTSFKAHLFLLGSTMVLLSVKQDQNWS